MKTLLLFLILFIFSCNTDYVPQKPYIIKSKYQRKYWTLYYYVDANGKTFDFEEKADKYNVGDTIK